jgi:hypothetical protein
MTRRQPPRVRPAAQSSASPDQATSTCASRRRATASPACQPGARPAGGSSMRSASTRAGGEEPGDDRVAVPHPAGCELVPAPGRRRHLRRELEEPPSGRGVRREAAGAVHGLGDVRDAPVLPAADLVPEDAQATGPRGSDRATRDHASGVVVAGRDWRPLDRESALRDGDFERRVVQVFARTPFLEGDQGLEHSAVAPDEPPARAERDPPAEGLWSVPRSAVARTRSRPVHAWSHDSSSSRTLGLRSVARTDRAGPEDVTSGDLDPTEAGW